VKQDEYARDIKTFKKVEEKAKDRLRVEKLKQQNLKPNPDVRPTENNRLKKFNLENTFIVQDATS
jgi:hypothetical protein